MFNRNILEIVSKLNTNMLIVGRVTIISLDATYNVRISILDSSISAPLKDLVEVRQVRHLKHDAVPAV